MGYVERGQIPAAEGDEHPPFERSRITAVVMKMRRQLARVGEIPLRVVQSPKVMLRRPDDLKSMKLEGPTLAKRSEVMGLTTEAKRVVRR